MQKEREGNISRYQRNAISLLFLNEYKKKIEVNDLMKNMSEMGEKESL